MVKPGPKPVPMPAPGAKVKAELKIATVSPEQDDDHFLETIHPHRPHQPAENHHLAERRRRPRSGTHLARMGPADMVNELGPRGDSPGTGRNAAEPERFTARDYGGWRLWLSSPVGSGRPRANQG